MVVHVLPFPIQSYYTYKKLMWTGRGSVCLIVELTEVQKDQCLRQGLLFWNNLICSSSARPLAVVPITERNKCLDVSQLAQAKQPRDVCVFVDFVPLKMHHQETEPSNTNPIFLMIQIALALAVPKSPLS